MSLMIKEKTTQEKREIRERSSQNQSDGDRNV